MIKRRVVITGIGVVSPFGVGSETFSQSLLDGKSAVRAISSFDTKNYRSGFGAEVPAKVYANEDARVACGNPAEDAAYLVLLAASEALRQAGVGPMFGDDERVGCVLGTLCAGARNMFKIASSYAKGEAPSIPIDTSLVYYQLGLLAHRHNLTGPSSLVSTACASSTDAIGYALDLIHRGECDRALAGGGDILAESVHGGFNSLFSISTNKPRPFDKERDGFVIGEGAGIFFLETLESARTRGAEIYAEVLGYGLCNTGFHLTATSEDGLGEALSIRRALADAGLKPEDIDYINTHGTATRHNDASEIKAVNAVFGDGARRILANSIKAAIGHCMGAAGILEAVATVFAIRNQQVPATMFTQGNEDGLAMDLVKDESRRASIRYAISESFGFGGACSCVVFGRMESGK